MVDDRWKPHVTVATVVERDGAYLLVHEQPEGVQVYNQPAGHLEQNESLIDAAERETLEETGWEVKVSHYLGLYRYLAPNGKTYLRHGFVAQAIKYYPQRILDDGIIQAVWWNYETICNNTHLMRSALVKELIDDYRAGKCYSLDLLHEDR